MQGFVDSDRTGTDELSLRPMWHDDVPHRVLSGMTITADRIRRKAAFDSGPYEQTMGPIWADKKFPYGIYELTNGLSPINPLVGLA